MVISRFCYDVKTRRAAAPPVLDPLYLNKHSVINDNGISFNFLCVNSQYNGQNSCGLDMFFPHVCTKLSMLSMNFWDSPRMQNTLSGVQEYPLLLAQWLSL